MFVDPSAKREVIQSAVDRLKPRAFFGSPKAHLLRVLHRGIRQIPIQVMTHELGQGEAVAEIFESKPDDPALITFTSGSTGQPKAVVRAHEFLLAQYEELAASLALREGEVDLITLPIFALANLGAGMTSVLADTNLALSLIHI